MTINLGDVVKDKLTGLKGVVIAKTEWLHGCTRVVVQPPGLTKDGASKPTETVDEPQVELVKAAKLAPVAPRHGPKPNETRHASPSRR